MAAPLQDRSRAPLAIQVLHLTLVDDRERDLLVGAERLVDDRSRAEVLELGANEGAALARLHVLELDHAHEALGKIECHTVLQVVGGDAHSKKSLENRVST